MSEGISERFDDVVLPHLAAARRLARWMVKNEHDAEDVVQEASLRAFRYFRTFTGGNGRAWFLRIVRNTGCGWLVDAARTSSDLFDEEQHSQTWPVVDPETLALKIDDATLIERAMNRLPDRVRRLLALRELQGLSYREIADVMNMPMGSVMSGLSRARVAFRQALEDEMKQRRLGDGVNRRSDAIPASQPAPHFDGGTDDEEYSSGDSVGGRPGGRCQCSRA